MLDKVRTAETVADLREQLNMIPRARLQFVKLMSDFLKSYDIRVSGDVLGKMTIAACDEIEAGEGETMMAWTN